MANIPSPDFIAKFECGDSYEKVGKWDEDTLGPAFAIDLTSPQSDRTRYRLNRDNGHQLVQKPLTPVFAVRRDGSVNTVSEFEQRHN